MANFVVAEPLRLSQRIGIRFLPKGTSKFILPLVVEFVVAHRFLRASNFIHLPRSHLESPGKEKHHLCESDVFGE